MIIKILNDTFFESPVRQVAKPNWQVYLHHIEESVAKRKFASLHSAQPLEIGQVAHRTYDELLPSGTYLLHPTNGKNATVIAINQEMPTATFA